MDMLQETMNAVVSLGRVKLAMYRSDMTEHIEIKSCFPTIIPRIVKIINYIKNRTPLILCVVVTSRRRVGLLDRALFMWK